jgi:tRNA-Thr(GGU) m(6)t(6)A37 methyltransferase TsaA
VSIGVIHSEHRRAEDTPIQPAFAEGCAGTVEVFPEYAAGLQDIDGFSHIILLYHFHRAQSPLLVVKPFLEDVERGVFATRHPRRPNGIGLSVVRLLRREQNVLFVEDVDILDGTPLLDIKPFIARHDAPEGARAGWHERIDPEVARVRGTRGYVGPPAETNETIADSGMDAELTEAIRFHGHLCPGLAIGFRASKIAMERLGAKRAADEEMVAIIENDSCSADGVQWVTGCTFGKGNLFFRDYGKQVFTFALRPTGRAVRVAIKRRDRRRGEPPVADRDARTRWLLSAATEDIFDVRDVTISLPDEARVHETATCARCGEEAMVTRTVERGGRVLCVPCAKESE